MEVPVTSQQAVSLPARIVTDDDRAAGLMDLARRWDEIPELERQILMGAYAHGSLSEEARRQGFRRYRRLAVRIAATPEGVRRCRLDDQARELLYVLVHGRAAS
jgi:hypothetical protein